MKILITGGSGFVGTRLVHRLKQKGHEYAIVDKKNSHYFSENTLVQDICDLKGLQTNCSGADTIVHLAAEHRDDVRPKSLYDDVNVHGTHNVCMLAEAKGINRIIFTSSVAVYGFAELNTDESGRISPFNDYGRTKYEAEEVLRKWLNKDPLNRSLVIVRPTVIFGEQNRGNVYNLLNQISSGKFVMIGNGLNHKSMAYVDNVAAFIEYTLDFGVGEHLYNYIDKPDVNMNQLVSTVYGMLGKSTKIRMRVPYKIGYLGGLVFDVLARVIGKPLPISSIRVKKFCSNTVFDTAIANAGFTPEVALDEALRRTVQYEFVDDNTKEPLFYSE